MSYNGIDRFGAYGLSGLQKFAVATGSRLPATYVGKRLASFMRSALRRAADQPVDVERKGFRLRLHLKDNACERRIFVTPQFFEPAETVALRDWITPAFNFVDVGANVGIYSLFVAHHSDQDAKILAIEPQAGLVDRLQTNIALNQFRIDVAPVAISDFEGDIQLLRNPRNLGGTSVRQKPAAVQPSETNDVPCRKLINVVLEHGFERIDAMKIDIEGHEPSVLLPFIEAAPESLWPTFLLMEKNDDPPHHHMLRELHDAGWREHIHCENNHVLVRN